MLQTTTVRILILVAGLGSFLLAGCGGSPSSTGSATTTTTASTGAPATNVYVIQNVTGTIGSLPQILQFTAGANGSVAPTSALTLPNGEYVESVAVDSSGQIYVGGILISQAAVIQVFTAGASGTAKPTRMITLASGKDPSALAVDASGQIYAASESGEVLVFSSTASGTAAPTRTLGGALTTLGHPADIAVDSAGTIYVATAVQTSTAYTGEIQVFAAGATGNVAPQRLITSSNVYLGVALDSSGNLYGSLDVATATGVGSIVQYAAGATGAATPNRTITGSATGISIAGALRVDAAGNIYVANQVVSSTSASYSLIKFASTASGNTAPIASTTSPSWTAGGPIIAIR